MYRQFFELTLRPFEPTTDPRWYFPGPGHEEAIASLRYTIHQSKGACLLTGAPGTGKSLALQKALAGLENTTTCVCIGTPEVEPAALLRLLAAKLGIDCRASDSLTELLAQLKAVARQEAERQRTIVLAVDNAHHCRPEALSILAGLDSDDGGARTLIQLLLVGQEPLRATLALPEATTIRQQLFRACRLKPFSEEQTAAYVRHRLRLAGAKRTDIFGGAALTAIHQLTGGVPRLIHQLCENALISSYADSHRTVKASTLRQVAEEVMLLGNVEASSPGKTDRAVSEAPPARTEVASAKLPTNAADGTVDRLAKGIEEAGRALADLERAAQDAEKMAAQVDASQAESARLAEANERELKEVGEKVQSLMSASQSVRKTFRKMVGMMRRAQEQMDLLSTMTARNEAVLAQLGQIPALAGPAMVPESPENGWYTQPDAVAMGPGVLSTTQSALGIRREKARLALERCSRVLGMLQASPDLFAEAAEPVKPGVPNPHVPLSRREVDHFTTLVDDARKKLRMRMTPVSA